MKIFILVLCIVFFALSQVRANNNDTTTVSRCNTTRTTIRQVLKTTMEELYHETIHNLEIIRQQCPSGWYRVLDSCLLIPEEKLNFVDATSRCRHLAANGRLFEPMSMLHYKMARQLVEKIDEEYIDVWMGITDIQVDGEFLYLSSDLAIAFNDWGVKGDRIEPNGGTNENCVQFHENWNFFDSGSWNDDSCSKEKYFMCEIPLLI
eukprot:04610.XXX_243635_242903_1 [CDS] Oithona nana genome sequencing.